jgi:hypothetical protein
MPSRQILLPVRAVAEVHLGRGFGPAGRLENYAASKPKRPAKRLLGKTATIEL